MPHFIATIVIQVQDILMDAQTPIAFSDHSPHSAACRAVPLPLTELEKSYKKMFEQLRVQIQYKKTEYNLRYNQIFK